MPAKDQPSTEASRDALQKARNKHRRRLLISSVAAGVVLLIIILFMFSLKVNFLLKEEMVIRLAPTYQSFSLAHGEQAQLEVESQLDNYWLCRAHCSYFLKDVSQNTILQAGTFNYSNHHKDIFSAILGADKLGYGQSVYTLSLVCSNIPSRLCPSSTIPIERSAIFTVNYRPNPGEQAQIESFKKSYAGIARQLNNATLEFANSRSAIEHLRNANTARLTMSLVLINASLFDYEKMVHESISEYERHNYANAAKILESSSLLEKANAAALEAAKLPGETANLVSQHNQTIEQLTDVSEQGLFLNTLIFTGNQSKAVLGKYDGMGREILEVSNSLAVHDFYDYAELLERLGKAGQAGALITNAFLDDFTGSSRDYIDLEISKALLCISAANGSCSIGVSSMASAQEIQSVADANAMAIEKCRDAGAILKTAEEMSRARNSSVANLTSDEKGSIGREKLLAVLSILGKIELQMSEKNISGVQGRTQAYARLIYAILEEKPNVSVSYYSSINESIALLFDPIFAPSLEVIQKINGRCIEQQENKVTLLWPISLEYENLDYPIVNDSRLDIEARHKHL
ncbi:hypothetical protein J4227_07720 [Candidatus Woesearchaeota archaeon]|nr:hypothetical protein [Candidatus Woesearchaeota archaeon]